MKTEWKFCDGLGTKMYVKDETPLGQIEPLMTQISQTPVLTAAHGPKTWLPETHYCV